MGQEVDPVIDASRDIIALIFNEIADHNCFLGGRPVEKPKHPGDTFWLVEIMVAAGFYDQARREALQAAVKNKNIRRPICEKHLAITEVIDDCQIIWCIPLFSV